MAREPADVRGRPLRVPAHALRARPWPEVLADGLEDEGDNLAYEIDIGVRPVAAPSPL